MKHTINEDKQIQLESVFNPITFVTEDNEKLTICMRDSGYEFKYQDNMYSAQKGLIKPMVNEGELFKMWENEFYDKYSDDFDFDIEAVALGFFMAKGLSYEKAISMYQYCIKKNKY